MQEMPHDKDPEKFAERAAGGAEVTAEEFLELMKGCDVRTMEDNAEAFAAGDTYVSLPYRAKMLAGFLQYNGLIDSIPIILMICLTAFYLKKFMKK